MARSLITICHNEVALKAILAEMLALAQSPNCSQKAVDTFVDGVENLIEAGHVLDSHVDATAPAGETRVEIKLSDAFLVLMTAFRAGQ